MLAPRRCPWLTLPVLLVLASSPAHAESDLRLPMPQSFGSVPASTYDEKGRRVGDARLAVERLEDGTVRMSGVSGYDGAARNVVTALLAPVDGGSALRLLEQTSRSFDDQSRALGQLTVDHRGGQGRCAPPTGSDKTLSLPDRERIANIPVNLLFLPLAKGELEQVDFQVFLCSGKPRVVNAKARVARRVKTEDGFRDIVEVRYDLDLGPILSRLARPFMPEVAVWFDPEHPQGWLAHRMPLFAKGPTVTVVRTGVAPDQLN